MPVAPRSFCSRKCFPTRKQAFSLIEVVLALGVLSFAILTIVALLPIGLQSNRDSYEESVGTNLIAALVADWRALQVGSTNTTDSSVYQLPRFKQGMTLTNVLWVTEGGQRTNSAAAARYRVAYKIAPPPTLNSSFAPYYVSFVVSWPAQATNAVSSVESIAAIPAQ